MIPEAGASAQAQKIELIPIFARQAHLQPQKRIKKYFPHGPYLSNPPR
jgi:hypothetical protein